MKNTQLEQLLNTYLNSSQIQDYAPNGLQVAGKEEVQKLITGVTACQALIDYAISVNADGILVHHGYFWKGEDPRLIGIKGKRIKSLMQKDLNLFAYHLPLDVHPELGNNALLAKALGIEKLNPMEEGKVSIPVWGEREEGVTVEVLAAHLNQLLQRQPLVCSDNAPQIIKKIGLCTGAAQDYIELAAQLGLDAFITGEVSERTIHLAREYGIHFFSCGHHATERFGIQALGEWLAQHHGLAVEFKDIPNPV